jgi:hypothetical protein
MRPRIWTRNRPESGVKFKLKTTAFLLLAGSLHAAAAAATPCAPEGVSLLAATKPWKVSLVASLNISQAHYSNWASGGSDSLSWIAQFNGSAELDQPHYTWANDLNLAFGENSLGAQSQKVADIIHADTTYTRIIDPWTNPFAGVTWDTQFDTGYQYNAGGVLGADVPLSKFQDPGFLVETLGFCKDFGDVFKVRIGAAARQTFAEGPYDTVTRYTPDGQVVYDQYGVSGTMKLKLSFSQNILFTSDVEIFSNLYSMDDVDAACNNILCGKINNWVSANANCDLLYNNIQSTGGQLYEGLSLCFTYNLI